MLKVSRTLCCPHQNIDIKTIHKLIWGYLSNMFSRGTGIIDTWCPEINQITNKWWISEAVGNCHRKTGETWDLCVLKTHMPKGTFRGYRIIYNQYSK